MRQPASIDLQEILEIALRQSADKDETITAIQQVAALYANAAAQTAESRDAQLFVNNIVSAAQQTAQDHQAQTMAIKLEQSTADGFLRLFQAAADQVEAEAQAQHAHKSNSVSAFWRHTATDTVEQSDQQAPSISV